MSTDIIKLVVGIDSLEDFVAWQKKERHEYDGQDANLIHTRYCPKQADEILRSGGSAYRVIKGRTCCRQKILGFEQIQRTDGSKACVIYTDTQIIETYHKPQRAFQGWRYLKNENRPKDLGVYDASTRKTVQDMPAELVSELREAGLL